MPPRSVRSAAAAVPAACGFGPAGWSRGAVDVRCGWFAPAGRPGRRGVRINRWSAGIADARRGRQRAARHVRVVAVRRGGVVGHRVAVVGTTLKPPADALLLPVRSTVRGSCATGHQADRFAATSGADECCRHPSQPARQIAALPAARRGVRYAALRPWRTSRQAGNATTAPSASAHRTPRPTSCRQRQPPHDATKRPADTNTPPGPPPTATAKRYEPPGRQTTTPRTPRTNRTATNGPAANTDSRANNHTSAAGTLVGVGGGRAGGLGFRRRMVVGA